MTTEREEITRNLEEMNRHIGRINRPDFPPVEPDRMGWHNERQQGEILRRWERIAALSGEHGIAMEAGFEMGPELMEMSGSHEPPEERAKLQKALSAVLEAADRINHPPEDTTGGHRPAGEMNAAQETARAMIQAVDGPKKVQQQETDRQHNDAMRELLLEAWENLAHAAGRHLTAIRMGRQQPVVPFGKIRNSWEALGVAAFHAGSAELDYGMIRAFPEGRDHRERYESGERDARIAHHVLHWIHEELAHGERNEHAPEIRKYAREMNILLTRERARAAVHLGMEPVPWESDCLQHHDIDHLQKRSTAAESPA